MDLILTTSQHSKKGFVDSVYDQMNDKTKQKVSELRLTTPIEILFEGADLKIYNKTKDIHKTVLDEMKDIKEDFCYLFVGHWLKGHLGQDRKDIGMMLKTFCETFKRKAKQNRPGIIIKTSGAGFSVMDREDIESKIQNIIAPYRDKAPSVYFLHGDLTDAEMNSLYNHPKVKAMVSFTKGEGFGRPLLEFSITGKPVIASNWSGQVDFLHPENCFLLPGELTDVHDSAADKFIVKGSKWFTVNYSYASKILQDVVDNYKKYCSRSRKQTQYVKDNFSLEKMSELFIKIIDKGLTTVPQQIKLKLPELKKVDKQSKIQLPKIKKVTA